MFKHVAKFSIAALKDHEFVVKHVDSKINFVDQLSSYLLHS